MTTPFTTEMAQRLEQVRHDSFIDDLAGLVGVVRLADLGADSPVGQDRELAGSHA